MSIVKLNTHQRNHYPDDIVICQKDFPDIKIGDIVEIYSTDDSFRYFHFKIICKLIFF